MSLASGTRLGPYEIAVPLGAGGMGEVYRARDTRLGRDVAVKVMPSEAASNSERLRRFEQEARAAAALNHPNILVLYDIGTQDGAPYMVTELLNGQTLRQRLREGPMAPAEALELGLQVAQGLAAAHGRGILHRDIKPENLFITGDGRVKILDFGLARLRAQEPITGAPQTEEPTADSPTRRGTILGTVGYMSPEQAEGRTADVRADLFSFGAVLYEMVAGRRAFEGDSPVSVLSAILTKSPPAAGSLRPGVPSNLDKILKRCLEKDRERRYPSAGELCKDLTVCHEAMVHRGISVRALLRNPRFTIPAALLLIAIAAGATWFGMRAARQTRARTQLIPEIERLAKARDYWGAFLLVRRTQPILGEDPLLKKTLQEGTCFVTWKLSLRPMEKGHFVKGDPTPLENAEIFVRPTLGDEASWVRLGTAGGTPLLCPRGYAVYRFQHPLAETRVVPCKFDKPEESYERRLYPKGQALSGMALARGGGIPITWVNHTGYDKPSSAETGIFWVDVFEVTNREFKTFVDGGGYQKRELWKHPFVKDGKALSWEEALALFKDATGRPGPAKWELSNYPAGQADYPVTGVSWYEAAAYAESVGKRLPTVSHWDAAVDVEESGFYAGWSNFSGRVAPVGTFPGAIDSTGLFDIAGNAREWCFNEAGDGRVTLGEAATGAVHYFNWLAPRPPFDRSAETGFRCIKPMGTTPSELDRPLRRADEQVKISAPFSEDVWQTWLSFLSYTKTPLDARTELADDSSPDWRMEKVSFTAAYGGERMLAYLFLPKKVPPPYQAIVFWPGGGPIVWSSSDNGRELPYLTYFDYLVKDGRAVLYPALKGTFERGGQEGGNLFEILKSWGDDMLVMQVKDVCRSVDLLQSRPDIAGDKIGYLGVSWGACIAPMPLAHEKRVRAASLVGCAFNPAVLPSSASWARRVTTPLQMLSGRFDYLPVETAQVPLFNLFATPPQQKRHLLFNAGHGLDGCEKEMMARTLEWYDKYLGPVRK